MAEAAGLPITVTDDDGDKLTIDAGPHGSVVLIASEDHAFYTFSGERHNTFTQAWAAASRKRATFPITARYAYPDHGWAADQATAAEHLKPGEVYQISRMEVGGFRTVLYLLDFPGVEFNAIQFAPAGGADDV